MTTAKEKISEFMHDNENMEDTWKVYTRNPFSMAYDAALAAFTKTLEDQAKADAWKLQLMTLALSMCGGGIMTAAFGTMAIKTIAGNYALNVICNNNMERAFKVAYFVSTNKTANFIAGKVWDEIESRGTALVSATTVEALSQTVQAFPSADKGNMSAFTMDKTLETFIGEAKIKAHNIAADIRDNSKVGDDEKIALVDKMRAKQVLQPAHQDRRRRDAEGRDRVVVLPADGAAGGLSAEQVGPEPRHRRRAELIQVPQAGQG